MINRSVGSKIWNPNLDSRVCSEHFVDLGPSENNPYPALKLGYAVKPVVSRKPPKERFPPDISASTIRKRRKISVDLSEDQASVDKTYSQTDTDQHDINEIQSPGINESAAD